MPSISWEDFQKIDIRTGTIISAEEFPGARKRAYKLQIDLGEELGMKRSSAQITALYSLSELVGRQVIAVVNFPPKQIGNFFSECLVLGIYNEQNNVVLLEPERKVPNGSKIG
jgi:tRNA-binding protein